MVLKLSGLTKNVLLQYAKTIGCTDIDVTISVAELRYLIEKTQGTQESRVFHFILCVIFLPSPSTTLLTTSAVVVANLATCST